MKVFIPTLTRELVKYVKHKLNLRKKMASKNQDNKLRQKQKRLISRNYKEFFNNNNQNNKINKKMIILKVKMKMKKKKKVKIKKKKVRFSQK